MIKLDAKLKEALSETKKNEKDAIAILKVMNELSMDVKVLSANITVLQTVKLVRKIVCARGQSSSGGRSSFARRTR